MFGREKDEAEDGWAFGDVWKDGSPDDEPAGDTADYVEVLRGDTGKGLDDTVMMEYVLYLGEHGIGATFESYPLEQIKIYVLRAEASQADEARRLLQERRERGRSR
jgi:hypothetical protein